MWHRTPELRSIADYWAGYATRRARAPIGKQTASFTRRRNAAGESTMGDLVADWALWAGRQPADAMADPGSDPGAPADLAVIAVAPRVGQAVIAADLVHDGATGGTVTLGQAWHAVGFGDPILTVTVTGAQIHDALEEQWAPTAGGGLGFAPAGRLRQRPLHVRRRRVRSDGGSTPPMCTSTAPHSTPARSYRLAAPSYTLINQDGFSAFTGFTAAVRHQRDYESFVAFVRAKRQLAPAPLNRVAVKNADAPGARVGSVVERLQMLQPDGSEVPRPEAALRTGVDRRPRGAARPPRVPGALLIRAAAGTKTRRAPSDERTGPGCCGEGEVRRRPWPWWRRCRRTPDRTAP